MTITKCNECGGLIVWEEMPEIPASAYEPGEEGYWRGECSECGKAYFLRGDDTPHDIIKEMDDQELKDIEEFLNE